MLMCTIDIFQTRLN